MSMVRALSVLLCTSAFAGGFQGNGKYTPIEQGYGKHVIELQQYLSADPNGFAVAKKLGLTNPKALREQLLADKLFPLDDEKFEKLGADPNADRALVAEDALLKLQASPEQAKAVAASAKQIPATRLLLSELEITRRFPVAPAPVDLQLGEAVLGGPGCAQGLGVSTRIDEKRGLIDLRFNSFFIDSVDRRIARTSCNLVLPVEVPENHLLMIDSLDTSAIVDNPAGGKVQLNFEAFFAGSTGPKISKTIAKATSKREVSRTKLSLVSSCGRDVNLRLNANAILTTQAGAIGMVAIDRAILKVSLKKCP
jgi:hypothetical protein